MKIVNSPINICGKKLHFLEGLFDHFPDEIGEFIEPFCGSGSVFLNLRTFGKLANRVYINDLNRLIFLFFKLVYYDKKTEEIAERILEMPYSKEIQNFFMSEENEEITRVSAWLLASSSRQYGDILGSQKPLPFCKDTLVGKLKEFAKSLCQPAIYNIEAMPFLKMVVNASKSPFVYLDPPYANTKAYGSLSSFDIAPILDFLDERGVKYILSEYSSNKAILKRFEGRWCFLEGKSRVKFAEKPEDKREALFFSKDFKEKTLFSFGG